VNIYALVLNYLHSWSELLPTAADAAINSKTRHVRSNCLIKTRTDADSTRLDSTRPDQTLLSRRRPRCELMSRLKKTARTSSIRKFPVGSCRESSRIQFTLLRLDATRRCELGIGHFPFRRPLPTPSNTWLPFVQRRTAPCGLRGVMRPWFDLWFRRRAYFSVYYYTKYV